MKLAHDIVRVTRDREWWRKNYRACVNELIRALADGEEPETEQVLPLLAVLSEAAQLPEIEALEARIRMDHGLQLSEPERAAARRAVTWVGTPSGRVIGA